MLTPLMFGDSKPWSNSITKNEMFLKFIFRWFLRNPSYYLSCQNWEFHSFDEKDLKSESKKRINSSSSCFIASFFYEKKVSKEMKKF